ncbi:MAG: putative acetyltransferase [Amycolatopsis sp.]|uniref:GNAT family N-acetyltransferase n=1 Tax=Amycolatopsis sp. TaxID=37632 RepID=UPI00261DA30A|nr:GNAT family N-acetyltransferase [Amycolatopsis sp.]MCU1681455.1 putative acetyltransferase [Amycolatopsis sp.]
MSNFVFTRTDEKVGEVSLRPVDPAADAELLHSWLTNPKCSFWGMLDYSLDDVRRRFSEIAAGSTHEDFIGMHDGKPACLFERYEPASELGPDVYTPQAGDKSIHFLAAPTDEPVPGFTIAGIKTMVEFLLDDPAVLRVVGEPDVRHRAMLKLVCSVGFKIEKEIDLPDKRAYLCTATREEYYAAIDAHAVNR